MPAREPTNPKIISGVTEIEVTPEMIDAGVNVFFDVEFELLSPAWTLHELAEKIICAALQSRNAPATTSEPC